MAEKKNKPRILPFVLAALTGGMVGPKLGTGLNRLMDASDMSGMTNDEWKAQKGFEEYTTPKSYTDELGLRKTQMRQEMPGYSQQKQDINSATASTLSSAQNLQGSDAAAVLLGAGQNRLTALRGLGIQAAQYGQRQQEGYTQAVGRGAQYEDAAYNYNQWLPQQMRWNEQQGLQNSGTNMMLQGIDQGIGMMTQGLNLNSIGNMGGGQQQQGMVPQQYQYSPYFQNQMSNMGANQVVPSTNLGNDPYANGYQPPTNQLPWKQ